ncbi:transcription and mRNA export factor SUS1-like [Chenopodium quinoa]|uniref:transcription and mRNA export factor SUS1-like n=1 Tax=Chenopodium quinoa TaxID=63459 RepID=UPI000B79610D|nr:transcription and mRNA export factor SUS1-like [Chenopodium quinoa]
MRHSVNRPPTPDAGDEQEKELSLSEKINIKGIYKKKGRNNVTVDDLVHLITPKGRASIPDPVKAELLQRIWAFLNAASL